MTKDDPNLWKGLVTLWLFILLVILGGINDKMAYRNNNLDITGGDFWLVVASLPQTVEKDEQGDEPARESREEVKEEVRKVSWYDYKHDGINCDDPLCITASGEPWI